jgi:hypothetical protein
MLLTTESHRLKSSDSAQNLQYDSGPSHDFLAKIFGVNTQQLFVIQNSIVQFLYSELTSAISTRAFMQLTIAQLEACSPTTQEARVRA